MCTWFTTLGCKRQKREEEERDTDKERLLGAIFHNCTKFVLTTSRKLA